MLIPLEFLFIIWLAATVVSFAASFRIIRAGNKSMGYSMLGFAGGALAVLSFYAALLFLPISGNLDITISWSRWVHLINGMAILSAAVAAMLVYRDKSK